MDDQSRKNVNYSDDDSFEHLPNQDQSNSNFKQEHENNSERLIETDRSNSSKSKKSFWKWLLSIFAVAVFSSLLTIVCISYFGLSFFQNENEEQPVSSPIQSEKNEDVEYTTTFSSTDEATIADVVEEVSPTIVGVINIQQMQNRFNLQNEDIEAGTGSGVLFHKDKKYAYIITNYHVIDGASDVEISLYDGEEVEAEIVGTDALTDLAVLRVDAKFVDKVANFGDSDNLRPGEEVIAIGNPLGLDFSRTVTQGIISAVDRSVNVTTPAGDWELNVLQTDAAINPGNSGGALINSRGEVIGINSLKISKEGVEGLGFAIPSNDVIPIAEQLIRDGEVKRAFLGISMYDIEDIVPFYRQNMYGNIENGIVVIEIAKGSPADIAGLQVNDIIVGINGHEVENTSELRKFLYSHVKPGDVVEIEFYRDGEKQTVRVKTVEN